MGADNACVMSVAGFDALSQRLLCSRFIAGRQWDRALAAAQDWLAQDPGNARAHLHAGQALINLKRHTEAENHLRGVLAAQPENDTALRWLSIVQFEQKRYREADESIHQAIALDPRDYHHWYHLAVMCYKQRDLASAKKFGEKAGELNPREPDVLNLLALCEPRDGDHSPQRLEQYHQALELNPESPEIHNNIGVYYLNDARDYEKAEAAFRRALFFNPGLRVARTNLFLTLKHRDRVYRCLCAPKDFLLQGFGFMRRRRRQNLLIYILLLPLWFLAIRYVAAGLLLWCLLVWPMVKAYEKLTIGDIRHQAGEIGARRGGFLGYRRWPARVRLGIFAALLLAFWSGVGLGVYRLAGSTPSDLTWAGFGLFLLVAMLGLLVYLLKRIIARRRIQYHAWRRGRRFDGLLGVAPKKRPWWRPWRRPADAP